MLNALKLDAKGVYCPDFQILFRRFIHENKHRKQLIFIESDEKAALRDITYYCNHMEYEIIDYQYSGQILQVIINCG